MIRLVLLLLPSLLFLFFASWVFCLMFVAVLLCKSPVVVLNPSFVILYESYLLILRNSVSPWKSFFQRVLSLCISVSCFFFLFCSCQSRFSWLASCFSFFFSLLDFLIGFLVEGKIRPVAGSASVGALSGARNSRCGRALPQACNMCVSASQIHAQPLFAKRKCSWCYSGILRWRPRGDSSDFSILDRPRWGTRGLIA